MSGSITRVETEPFDMVQLIIAMTAMVDRAGWSDNNQIALSHLPGEGADSFHGLATQASRQGGEVVMHDNAFNHFNAYATQSYFYTVWTRMLAELGSIYRMRLIKLPPRSCLSFHEDFHVRYHVPIQTNAACFHFVNEAGFMPMALGGDLVRVVGMSTYHMRADGTVYRLDTEKKHTAYNGGNKDRIHLVFSADQ